MITVKFPSEGVEFEVKEGARLLDAALDHAVEIPHPCGGNGVCGGCRVKITEGFNIDDVSNEEYDLIDEDDINEGYRLACCTEIKKDIEVEL